MMNGLNSIRRERASLERDRVVFGSMLEDAEIADAFESVIGDVFESVTDEEIEDLIDKIPESDEDDAQIERILKAGDEGLDVDEILGVDESCEFF